MLQLRWECCAIMLAFRLHAQFATDKFSVSFHSFFFFACTLFNCWKYFFIFYFFSAGLASFDTSQTEMHNLLHLRNKNLRHGPSSLLLHNFICIYFSSFIITLWKCLLVATRLRGRHIQTPCKRKRNNSYGALALHHSIRIIIDCEHCASEHSSS